ncbi:MAG: PqiC family protein [Alphaproteobacteria bacterium]|nr:PqiC family protein [Alphaproteobacteria bacterium]
MKCQKFKAMRLLFVAALMFPLSSCITLRSDVPPPSVYRIEAPLAQDPIMLDLKRTTVMIVTEPSMPAGFSGKDITLHYDGGRRQDRYAGALWADDLSGLIQQFITNQARYTFPNLVLDNSRAGLNEQYKLYIDVLDFQPVYSGEASGVPILLTRLRFTLTGGEENSLLSDIVLERKMNAADNNLSVITAGLESQLADIVSEALEKIAFNIK